MPETLFLTEGTRGENGRLQPFVDALNASPPAAYVVSMGDSASPRPILAPSGADGRWESTRYAGELTVDGTTLVIEPRMGWDALHGWVGAATDMAATPTVVGTTASRVAPLVGLLWVRAVDGASRHGPPSFRRDVPHVGTNMRGRLDVRSTVRLRAKGSTEAASVYRTRDLDNPVTRIIVAADRVLTRQFGHGRWHTDRVDAILPQLYTAVGRRSSVPAHGELQRMRYTPITRPFKWAAELSSRIVRQDPVSTTPRPGRAQGVVIDLDSVWRGALLTWARSARQDLRSDLDDAGDVIMRDAGTVRAAVGLTGEMGASGAPVLEVSRDGFAQERMELSANGYEAARLVREALTGV
jgi:5-methylcytosine-specific restriction enzyme subunit McrC